MEDTASNSPTALNTAELASELEFAIHNGTVKDLKKLLYKITDPMLVQSITYDFEDRDPVTLSVDLGYEDVALYLIEKGFPTNIKYQKLPCDSWCEREHHLDLCPRSYDVYRLAGQRSLTKVRQVMEDIQKGSRHVGDSLSPVESSLFSSCSNKTEKRNVPVATVHPLPPTDASAARERLMQCSENSRHSRASRDSSRGNATIHMCDTPSMVYVCACSHVPINAQNYAGDTALHEAVRNNDTHLARALLICGADVTCKNKLGQTPLDTSRNLHGMKSKITSLVEDFKPGILAAVKRGDFSSVQRLTRRWCCLHSNVKDGYSVLELAKSKSSVDENMNKIYSHFLERKPTLDLVHAVLAEDEETVSRLLSVDISPRCNVNARYRDGRHGRTLAACAIQQRNLSILEQLVNNGANLNVRVRVNEDVTETEPLYFKTLEKSSPDELWRFVRDRVDRWQHSERDIEGDTPIFRALKIGKPAPFLESMIRHRNGANLVERNQFGQTLVEKAAEMGRSDIIQVVDKFLESSIGSGFLMQLPVAFYGEDQMAPHYKGSESLLELARNTGSKEDLCALETYQKIENIGVNLFVAAVNGDIPTMAKLNSANFQDKHGYTALIKAIVSNQLEAAELLITDRPVLKSIPDNCNRYPLHFAYALPESEGEPFVKLLLRKNPADIEHRVDKDGRAPVEYKDLQETEEMEKIISDAKNLDPYGNFI